MTTSETLLDQHTQSQQAIQKQAAADLEQIWGMLDFNNPEACRDLLIDTMVGLTTQYGQISAVEAADYYDTIRKQDGAPGRFEAPIADPFSAEAVAKHVRYRSQHLFTNHPEKTLKALLGDLQKYVRGPGRTTLLGAGKKDPAGRKLRWARIPTGSSTCPFCVMLASRGFVYLTQDSAGGQFGKFHGKCDCRIVPSWADPPPRYKGYDPQALYQQWQYMEQFDAKRKAERLTGFVEPTDKYDPYWRQRQQELGINDHGEILEIDEIKFVERFRYRGELIEWIPTPPVTNHKIPSHVDFVWHSYDGKDWDLKSPLAPKYVSIRRSMSDAIAERKFALIIDLGMYEFTPQLRYAVSGYLKSARGSQITDFFVLSEDGRTLSKLK